MSPSYAFADLGEDSSPYVCPVEAELRRMNEQLAADVEDYENTDLSQRGILTESLEWPLHEPLPDSPAWFARETLRNANIQPGESTETMKRQSTVLSSGNSSANEEQCPEPALNEPRNNMNQTIRPSEEASSNPPQNDLEYDDLEDFPPELRALRGMVMTIQGAEEGADPAEHEPSGPSPFFTEVDSEGEADSPEQGMVQDAGEEIPEDEDVKEDTVDDEDEEYVEAEAEEVLKEEENDAGETDAAVLTGSSSGTVPPRKRKRTRVLKVQTRDPFKRVRPNPRPTNPEWPEFLPQPLSAQAIANPAGFRAAHDWIAAEVRDVTGLKSITKTCGLIKRNASGGLGDWKAGVITHYLNAWIKHKHDEVLFRHGARDHAAQIQWYDSRTHAEQDEFRIWVMTQAEAALRIADRNKVQQLRLTHQPIVKPLDRAIAAGTWRHPTLGGAPNANVHNSIPAVQVPNGAGQVGAGNPAGTALIGHARGNRTSRIGLQLHHQQSQAGSGQQSGRRDRVFDDDEYQEDESQDESGNFRLRKKLRGTSEELDPAPNGSQDRRNAPTQRRQNLAQQTMKCERDEGNSSSSTSGFVAPRNSVQTRAPGARWVVDRGVLPASRPMSATEPRMTDGYQFLESRPRVQGFGEPPSAGYSENTSSGYPDPEDLDEPHEPYYQNGYGDQF